jgi:LacI family transcriptional regulator
MLVPHLENPFFAHLVRCVESQLHLRGFQLIVADSHADTDVESQRLRLLEASQVDGILVIPAWFERSADVIARVARDLPLVQLDRLAGAEVADFVGVDNVAGMRDIVTHLIDRGARSAIYIGGDDATSPGRERAEALRRAAEEHGMDLVGEVRHQFTLQTGRDAARGLRSLPDAIVCGDDLIALGAMGELIRSGLRVPDDVMITGFDGTVMARAVEPALTTIEQPVEAIAERAVSMLMARREKSDAHGPQEHRLRPSLFSGRSTAVGDDLPGAATNARAGARA